MHWNINMFKNRAEQQWVCNYHNSFILILILSYVSQIQCQIIRKSIELPVRDYLSSPRTGRDSRDARDQFYVLGNNLDSVRTFEVLSQHTPASALMFAGLERNSGQIAPSQSTPLTPNPNIENKGRIEEVNKPKSLRSNRKNVFNKNIISRSSAPSIKLQKDGLNVAKKGYSFSFTAPSSDNHDIRGSHGSAQEFLPIYTTPFPSLHENNDAAFGYFNKFPFPLPIAREGIVGYNIGRFEDNLQYSTPVPTQFTTFNHEKNIQSYPSQTPTYYPTTAYYPEKELSDYYQQKDSPQYNYPSGYRSGQNTNEKYSESINSQEYKQPSATEDRSIHSTEEKQLPTIPPTIGVIGWKSNTDLNTNWKPNNALMDMANKQIKEDLKNEGYDKEANINNNNEEEPSPQGHQEVNEEETSEDEEENKNSGGNDEEENDETEEAEEGEEEEEDGEEEHNEEEDSNEEEENPEPQNENDHRLETPLDPRQKYEHSAEDSHRSEYSSEDQNGNKPYLGAGYYYDGQTLPPGPPYDPPPSEINERTKYGYLPPPSVTLGAIPYESFSGGVHQTWTPITPGADAQTTKGNKIGPQYKSENGRWLLNGGPILGRFPAVDELRFDNWEEFGKDKSRNQLRSGEVYSPKEYTSNEYPEKNEQTNNINTSAEDSYFGKKKIKSKDLPVEHRSNKENKEETASQEKEYSDETSKESDSNYEPPPPPPDLDEQRERNRVSDHEFPRKVPTRLRYPGGGLWAKPPPDSGIELGFVPKKVYTQTRRHNTVKHLPREAAFAAASTAEDVINAPRLREVVSHKKIQEVYEEEGYEDTGYDHGGYKKRGEEEIHREKQDSGEDTTASDWEGPAEEESFREHVAHLEAVPENDGSDASGQSSAKEQVVQTSENPKVKGSWKQQKTITNEKSMAFLDGEGKGGILTQRHLPKTEGVIGKVLEIEGKRIPIYQEISYSPKKLPHRGAVSYHSSENTNTGTEIPVVYSNDGEGTVLTVNPDFDKQYDESSSTQEDTRSQYSQGIDDTIFTTPQTYNIYETPEERPEQYPKLSSYVSRNNKFSFVPSKGEGHIVNGYFIGNDARNYLSNVETENRPVYTTTGQSYDTELPTSHDNSHSLEVAITTGESPHTVTQYDEIDNRPTTLEYSETSKVPLQQVISKSPWNFESSESHRSSFNDYDLKGLGLSTSLPSSHKKERKSRDLTAFGIDRFVDSGDSDFTHPTAELRAIEETISTLSSDVVERPTRSRQILNDTSGRRYKEIVRNSTTNRQESAESTQTRGDSVRVAKDDLNTRHPFLPRDDKGDVKIDYTQSRTRVQDSTPLRRRHHYREEVVEPTSTTEEPTTTTTTTTQKVTTVKSQPTTTTEYTPEDPAETLKRLQNNVFLAPIFKGKGVLEDKQNFDSDPETTTTPRVTTYRAKLKLTTESVDTQNSPSDAIERLKTNPFLTGIFPHDTIESTTVEMPSKRRRVSSRIRPIVVPDDISAESSVKHVEQLTLAQYSGPSNGLLYKEVPIVVQQRMTNLAQHLNAQGVDAMHIIVKRSVDDSVSHDDPSKDTNSQNVPVDVEKYPFYFSPETISISKHSPMRYASNPKDIPIKTHGGMEFYESRDKAVRCEEPSPPKNIVPKRKKEGEWNKNPQPDKQRMGKLGDQIDCLKVKYFGEDPLDNPFFKETVVGVPNLSTESPDDKFGFYSQIKSDIESDTGSNDDFFKSNNHHKRHINSYTELKYRDSNSKAVNIGKNNIPTPENAVLSNTHMNKQGTYVSENEVSGSKSPQKITSPAQENYVNQTTSIDNSADVKNENIEITKVQVLKLPSSDLNDMQRTLHPAKNVIISLKSKGTSNHPKIRYVSEVSPPQNMHIMIVPMGSIGYLKTHPSYHVKSYPTLKSMPKRSRSTYKKEPLYLLDPISTEASKITKMKKHPTTVTYMTVDSDGHLIHQHIRTFIPVRAVSKSLTVLPEKNTTTNWWDLPDIDARRGEPRYRVKRNNENDKYINSKESLELKNYLLKKYADILAKEKSESTTNPMTREKGSTEQSISRNIISSTTTRTSGGLVNKHRPPYSSRYSAVDPMHGSPSTDVETSRDVKSSESSRIFPIRKPALRFPKLAVPKLTSVSEVSSKSKLSNSPEPTPPRVITITTTTTTTEPPPSTTTRMYKPRVVYKKEYGKPIERVVNMFAVLNRQPTDASVQTTTVSSSTEYIPPEPKPNARRPRPKRIQQFEHRTITKEEVFRKTYGPGDEIKERSDRLDTYDSLYDHPDLRGPVSRISRETEEQHEVLVYMVNPTTGVGEWKYMQVPSSRISRMDQSTSRERSNMKKNGKRKKSRTKTFSSREDQEMLPEVNERLGPISAQDSEEDVTTMNPKKQRNKQRRKHNNSSNRNRMTVNGNRSRGTSTPPSPPPSQPAPPVVEESAPLEDASTTISHISDDSTTAPTSTFHPKVIVEPHKRKYFYAKI